jgi:hypothetical protein
MVLNYKGKDRIEFGYKPYAEASYGGSPGAVATTLYKIGYCRSIEPAYDPEWNRLWVLPRHSNDGRTRSRYTLVLLMGEFLADHACSFFSFPGIYTIE